MQNLMHLSCMLALTVCLVRLEILALQDGNPAEKWRRRPVCWELLATWLQSMLRQGRSQTKQMCMHLELSSLNSSPAAKLLTTHVQETKSP